MWPDDPSWQMTVLFLLALASMIFVMGLIALPATAQADRPCLFWLIPSPTSLRRLQPVENIRRVLLRAALLFGALARILRRCHQPPRPD